jgi:hypothetical protein
MESSFFLTLLFAATTPHRACTGPFFPSYAFGVGRLQRYI